MIFRFFVILNFFVILFRIITAFNCVELSIANAETISYSRPKDPIGRREENSIAEYTCMDGFKKAGNKATRVCKSGKFAGKEQLCVGVSYFEKLREWSSMYLLFE